MVFNPKAIANIVSNATNLTSDDSLVSKNAFNNIFTLSGSANPFQNASIYSSSSSDGSLYLGEGNHIVTTGAADNQIFTGAGNDNVNAGNGNNTLYLGEGFNIAITSSGNDIVYTGANSDVVNAGNGINTLYLGEGLNVAVTGNGNDLIYTGAADDIIKAGDGNNRIYAGEGSNLILTGKGSDLIHVGAGNDVIYTGAGDDTVYAGEGNNFISDGTGNNTVYVGSGVDRFELVSGDGSVTIVGFGSNDKIRLGAGLTEASIQVITANGDTLIKAGDDLLATLKWNQLSNIVFDISPVPISLDADTDPNVVSGIFTVGETGQVTIDYLFDGGGYEGELAIFSLSGLNIQPGSDAFIKESARRALSDSELGYVVIHDQTEGARFEGISNTEGNFNLGIYTGVKPVTMRPGDQFGLMLAPQGTIQQVLNQDPGSETQRPLLSVTQGDLNTLQVTAISKTGGVYGFEDLPITGQSDRDYNDVVFQIKGAVGQVVSLDKLLTEGIIQPEQDWRNSNLGRTIIDYAKPYNFDVPSVGETVSEGVIEILKGAANSQPVKINLDSQPNPYQAIIDNFVKSANERLTFIETNGQNTIDKLFDSVVQSEANLYKDILSLYTNLSNDGEYLNAWKNYLSDKLANAQTFIVSQLNDLRNEIIGTDEYLYQWADYTAGEINRTIDWLNEWTTYAQSEINRIDGLLDKQIDEITSASGTTDYNNLVRDINNFINGTQSTFDAERSDKDKVVTQSIDVFNAFDNYRVSVIENALKQYNSLNNEQFSTLTNANTEFSVLSRDIVFFVTQAWNQYQILDQTRLQVINEARSKAGFFSEAWDDFTGDTKELIKVWAKIGQEPAWYNVSGKPEQKVGLPLIGIIDTGFWGDNPDIDKSRITLGTDWIDQDNNPLIQPLEGQGNPHGTQVLEIIAATRDNGIGIDGINDRAPIWLGRALGSADWAQSLIEFVDAAKASKQPNAVINLSFDLTQTNADGSVTTRNELTPLERAALTYAQQNQILIVAAAGNQGTSLSALGQATSLFDNILVVGAADGWKRADYSNYSPVNYAEYGKGVDILANGTISYGDSGTSVATAKVTGAASLVWSANAGLSYTQVIDMLKRTATDLNTPGWDAETGVGLLNISAAVNLATATQAKSYISPNLDAIQIVLQNNGIPEAQWSEFYQYAYYQQLEAKLTGESWSVFDAIASEREAVSLKAAAKAVVYNVVKPVVQIFLPQETKFGGTPQNGGGSSGGGLNFSKLIGGARTFYNQRKTELDQVTQSTVTAYKTGKDNLVEKRNKLITEVAGGARNLNKKVEDVTPTIKGTLQNVQTAVSDPTTAIIETKNRIDSTVKEYGDRISDEARNVGANVQNAAKDLKQLYDENQQYLILVNPGLVIGVAIAEGLIDSVKEGKVGLVIDTLKRVPVLGTAVGGLEGLYYASQQDWKETLKSSIDSALAFYGGSNVVTPRLVSLLIDISWELKDEDYKGAVAAALSNFNVERKVADTFVNAAWALKDGNFKDVLDAGLSSAGFNNARQFVDIAWDVKDGNYQDALTVGLQVAGLNNLKIDQGKADAFVSSTFDIRDNKVEQVADKLLAIAGANAKQLTNSSWVQALRNGNPNDDRMAFSQGLLAVGFQDADQWVDIAWDVKENQYLDALSTGFKLGGFQQGGDWIGMAGALQRDDYLGALSTGFKIAGFTKGANLASAALALRKGDAINAFYEGLSLIDGVSELVDTFKYLKDGDTKKAVPLMIQAAPKLITLIT